MNISYNKKFIQDCKTRWNFIFLVFNVSIQYKDVFDRLVTQDTQYKILHSEIERTKEKEICERLKVFYDLINLFSGTEYPTINIYFSRVCEMNFAFVEWFCFTNNVIKKCLQTLY